MATAGPREARGAVARLALGRRKLRHHRGPEAGEVGRAGGEDELDASPREKEGETTKRVEVAELAKRGFQ